MIALCENGDVKLEEDGTPLVFGAIVGYPYVATTFGIIRLALSYFVGRWVAHLGRPAMQDQVKHIPKIHLKSENVTKGTNGRAAVGDATTTCQAESAISPGLVIVPKTRTSG